MMGWKRKVGIFLLPLILYGGYKLIKTYFLVFVLVFNLLSPRLPLKAYQELNPDINDFATADDEIILLLLVQVLQELLSPIV